MASPEVIALLCAGPTCYHQAARGGGAGDSLSRSELAGLLAGLKAHEMNLALAKWAGDLDAERNLIAHVRVWLAGVAVREDWRIIKGRPVLSNMAALAVFEVVRPNRCVKCFGRGVVGIKVCGCCSGSGHAVLSGRVVAEAIGMYECNYRRLWRARYDQVYYYVQAIDSIVNYCIHRADSAGDNKKQFAIAAN